MSANYYLIGELLTEIRGNNLPSNSQVLSNLLHRHLINRNSVPQSSKEIACQLETIWEAANIPTQNHYRIQAKMRSLYSKWEGIKINKKRDTPRQHQNEQHFVELLTELFDITYDNALKKMDLKDKELLELVEPIPIASLSDERKEYWRKFKETRRIKEDEGRNNYDSVKAKDETERQKHDSPHIPSTSSKSMNELPFQEPDSLQGNITLSNSESGLNNTTSDDSFVPPKKYTYSEKGKKKKNILTTQLTSALDRAKISDRRAVFVVAATVFSMGVDPENIVLNRESFRQKRRANRKMKADEIREAFNPETTLTVHWDGKIMTHLSKYNKVDRIVVAVTGGGITKLLKVPFLKDSSGENESQLVYDALHDWKILDRVGFMCFDTTSLNTGRKSGCCVLLEDKMGKDLLKLACRHHFLELVAGNAYSTALNDVSVSPGIVLFKKFREAWANMDKENYESCLQDKIIRRHILPIKDKIITFVQSQLNEFQPRDDYQELLYLSLLFLGEKPEGYTVHTCGEESRARWMGKLIYCLKIYLFRSQFNLSDEELKGIRYFNVFIVSTYIEYWYEAPCALTAASNDLKMLNDLVAFKRIHKQIANAAIDKLSRHLWYLSYDISGIAFFDKSIAVAEKKLMVKALTKKALTKKGTKRVFIDLEKIGKYKISNFISIDSLDIFKALNISQEFLKHDPETWAEREDYIHARSIVKKLHVVNDVAERGVAMASSFNGFITKDEEQYQFLLQVSEDHRNNFPNANKSVILKGLNRPD